MMRRLFVVILLSTFCASAFADDYDEGRAAYVQGDYATAISRFGKTSEQGNSYAQFALGHIHFYGQGYPKDDAQTVV
jgi:TPR repeat protein